MGQAGAGAGLVALDRRLGEQVETLAFFNELRQKGRVVLVTLRQVFGTALFRRPEGGGVVGEDIQRQSVLDDVGKASLQLVELLLQEYR